MYTVEHLFGLFDLPTAAYSSPFFMTLPCPQRAPFLPRVLLSNYPFPFPPMAFLLFLPYTMPGRMSTWSFPQLGRLST